MRVAETRAVNRALRKAYGIGICSVEEIGSFAEPASVRPRVEESFLPNRSTEEQKLRRPQGPRPSLPFDPPAPARRQPRQVLVLAYSLTKAASYRMSVAALKPGSWHLRAYYLFENQN